MNGWEISREVLINIIINIFNLEILILMLIFFKFN